MRAGLKSYHAVSYPVIRLSSNDTAPLRYTPSEHTFDEKARSNARVRPGGDANPRFDHLSDGSWFGALPQFHVVMAAADTEEAWYHARQADLEAAITVALLHGRPVPTFAGVTTPTLEPSHGALVVDAHAYRQLDLPEQQL